MSENRFALLLVFMSMSLLAAGDVLVRLLGEDLHVGQVIAYRGVFLILMMGAGLMVAGYRFRRERLFNKWSLIRGVSETVATYSFFVSVQFVPIATATTIVFIFPVLLTLVSIPLYGEKVGHYRWFAVVIGFLGVAVISNPTGNEFHVAMVLPIITAIGLVGRDVVTRNIPKDISAAEVALSTAMIATTFGFLSFPFGWNTIETVHYAMLPLAAALAAVSFIFYVMAIRKGELSFIAPAQYLVILWAAFWGVLIWQEYPKDYAIFGGFLIVVSGCVIFWRESVHSKT